MLQEAAEKALTPVVAIPQDPATSHCIPPFCEVYYCQSSLKSGAAFFPLRARDSLRDALGTPQVTVSYLEDLKWV